VSVLPIVRWPDPRLSTPCAPVGDPDDTFRRLAADMLETMYAAPGRGLAGPQVGVMKRIFVMDVAWREGEPDPMVFLDPEIVWSSPETRTGGEGCLSIPGILAEVERAAQIDVAWRDVAGARHTRRFDGFAAICIQHETDHLDGLVTFDRVAPEVRAALEAAYAQVLA
jgi:peptide deformylase